MKANTVQVVNRFGVSTMTFEHFQAYTKLAGWKIKGYARSENFKLREEIEGQPIYYQLVGPMYGGEGIVRYETSDVAEVLSR